jgi:hypothetical protein
MIPPMPGAPKTQVRITSCSTGGLISVQKTLTTRGREQGREHGESADRTDVPVSGGVVVYTNVFRLVTVG